MDKYIESYNMQHLWSASNDGGREHALDVVDDEPAIRYTQQLLQKHPRYLGVLHTHGTHFPYYQNPQTKPYYKPCSSNSRAQWPQATINCYDNAIIHFTQQEAILLDNIDLSNTVVIFTADHGEAFLEHNAYFHGDLYDEVVHVPFVWYIPPAIVEKIPTENWQAFKQNLTRYVSVTDIVPSILHLSSLLTGQEPAYKKTDFTGRSLFEDRDNDLIIISGCLVDLVCTKRDVVFADENYFVLLKPNRANPVEIYPAKDLEQKHPLTPQEISLSKLQNIYEKAPQAHPLGGLLHSLLKKQFPQLENLSR